jgi:glycosyltransferase involved in cell wall biosynthesis
MSKPSIAINMLWCVPGQVGGSEEYFVRQLLGLHEINAPFDVTVFAPRGFSVAHPDVAQNVRVVEVGNNCSNRELRVSLENTWLANKTRKFDLVHHGGGTLPSRGNASTLLTIHDVQYLSYPQYFNAMKLRYLRNRVPSSVRRATCIATPTNYVRQSLNAAFGNVESRSFVVRHGMEQNIGVNATDEGDLRSRFHLGDARILIFPAMTHPHKNHEFVLRMLAGPWRDDNLKLVMAGGHGLADTHVNQMIVELGLGDRAIRIGRVDANDRDGLIRLAEALVFPSMYEGFGAPVVEAMALGTPVIASDCASLPEVVGDAGLVLPLEESAWADALNEVGRRRTELIARGQTRSAQFTSAKSAEDLCVAYDAALTLSRAGRT